MKKISLLSILMLSGLSFAASGGGAGGTGNGGWPVTGGTRPVAPIDTNAIILIVAAVAIIIAMVAYKKISARKVA
ncbi:hypothetical protein EQP59_09530 [Ornithobacterium rhinotracheale]|uniref:Signal peptidase n=1 Tax=Ornithobacterium rhinotracheale TaxID=28251 RepID=A0A410JTN8_ORNRH|nr:hypothetical protein [Ornithobacterium rhinotracheale]QAR31562.1 hypothetical protein EQP59_09530 [Ornithobacterium rhinotracheale]